MCRGGRVRRVGVRNAGRCVDNSSSAATWAEACSMGPVLQCVVSSRGSFVTCLTFSGADPIGSVLRADPAPSFAWTQEVRTSGSAFARLAARRFVRDGPPAARVNGTCFGWRHSDRAGAQGALFDRARSKRYRRASSWGRVVCRPNRVPSHPWDGLAFRGQRASGAALRGRVGGRDGTPKLALGTSRRW